MDNLDVFSHLEGIKPFLAMEIAARAHELEKKGRDVIHLEFGEPDFPTPEVVSKAAIQAIGQSKTRYTHTQGVEEFRRAVVGKYQRKYGINLTENRILTSSGSSVLLFLAIRLLVPPGKELILTDPCYSCYQNLAKLAGVEVKRVRLRLENGFQPDIDEIIKQITPKTGAILINSPMNPTGTMLSDESLKALTELGIPLISDEIYGDLVYEGHFKSILQYTHEAVVLNGLSKYYSMTGWRLGYMILPVNWMKMAAKIHQNLMISASDFIQHAAVAALEQAEQECERNRKAFNERRLFLLKRLAESGLDPMYRPTGAFYVFFRYPDQSKGSLETAIDILEKTGVALTPGIDFGQGGEGFIRFSYANSMEKIDEAVKRLNRYFFG